MKSVFCAVVLSFAAFGFACGQGAPESEAQEQYAKQTATIEKIDTPAAYEINFDAEKNSVEIKIDTAATDAARERTAARIIARLLPDLIKGGVSRLEISGFYDSNADEYFATSRAEYQKSQTPAPESAENIEAEKIFAQITSAPDNPEADAESLIDKLCDMAENGNRTAAERLADIYAKAPYGAYFNSFKNDALAEKYALAAASLGSTDYANELAEKYCADENRLGALADAIAAQSGNAEIAAICLGYYLGYTNFIADAACSCENLRFAPEFNSRANPRNAQKAFECAKLLADANPASDMCAPLIDTYLNGIGTQKNAETAYALARAATLAESSGDVAVARIYISYAYANSVGIKENAMLAEEYFAAALESDAHPISSAVVDAARQFYNGYAAPKDKKFALKILEAFIARPNADFSELEPTAIAQLAAIYTGKYAFADASPDALQKLNARAAEIELNYARAKIAERGLNPLKIPSAEELCKALLVQKIARQAVLYNAMRLANFYYIIAPNDAAANANLKEFIEAVNAAITPETLPNATLTLRNRQNRESVEFEFENGGSLRAVSHPDADTTESEAYPQTEM